MKTEFKGTKGTWSANSADTIFSEEMVMICEVNAESYESRKSNAHLIAAAPELLEALILCREFIYDVQPGCAAGYDHLSFTKAKADAAINKALNLQ